jgi:hypothetical protein
MVDNKCQAIISIVEFFIDFYRKTVYSTWRSASTLVTPILLLYKYRKVRIYG